MSIIGSLFNEITFIVLSIAKSHTIYFQIEYVRLLESDTLNGIQVKNTKYCVINIETAIPTFVLKNLLSLSDGTLSRINLCIARYAPCNMPHMTKFQDAPCHSHPKNIVINKLRYVLIFDTRLPPNVMYR